MIVHDGVTKNHEILNYLQIYKLIENKTRQGLSIQKRSGYALFRNGVNQMAVSELTLYVISH